MVYWLLITDRVVIEIMFFHAKLRNAIKVWTFSLVQTSNSFHWGKSKQESKVGVLFFWSLILKSVKANTIKETKVNTVQRKLTDLKDR